MALRLLALLLVLVLVRLLALVLVLVLVRCMPSRVDGVDGARGVGEALLFLQQSIQSLSRGPGLLRPGRPRAVHRLLQRTWGRSTGCSSRTLLGGRQQSVEVRRMR